jgi:hypothetical protein
MKRSNRTIRSLRRCRDSQAKLIIAKRRYQDALRRYQDAEGEAQISKFKALKAKIDEKFAMFAKDHPDAIKYLRKYSAIAAQVGSILSGIAAAGMAAIDIKTISVLKKHGFSLKEIAGMVPKTIGLFISALASVVLGFAAWAQKNKIKQAEQD